MQGQIFIQGASAGLLQSSQECGGPQLPLGAMQVLAHDVLGVLTSGTYSQGQWFLAALYIGA